MSEFLENNQTKSNPILEINYTDPKYWEKSEQDGLVKFFEILLKVDVKNNPDRYKSNYKNNDNINYPNQNNPNKSK